MENSDTGKRTPAQFAAWLRQQLERRGYDLRPRGGGQSRFAEDSGLGAGTISRMLRGQAATETRVLQTLAETLDVPLADVLVAAGVLAPADLSAYQNRAPRHQPMTPEEAADELGLDDPQARALFISMTHTLREQRSQQSGGQSAGQ